MAAAIVDQSTSDELLPDPDEGKNPAAVALGRLGGKKARAEKLTAEQRSEIARRAAAARWGTSVRQQTPKMDPTRRGRRGSR
jgi:hypothetical protein